MKNKALAFIKALLWGIIVILFPVLSGVIATVAKLQTVPTLFMQGGFMLLSLVIPLILVLCGKWKTREIGFGKFDAEGLKKSLYFLPALVIYIPVLIEGFAARSAPYALGALFLYLFVGIAEEVYFRGIVPKYLSKEFSKTAVIILSTVIFGIGHLATAFTGSGAAETALTVLNAFIFGWLAIEVTMLSGNVAIPILLHFLFDFETKFIAMSGTALLLAEIIRGALMFLVALWLAFVIRKVNMPKSTPSDACLKKRRKRRVILSIISGAVVVVTGIAVAAVSIFAKAQTKKIPPMSFEDCLAYTLGGNDDGIITVGVIKDGKSSYTVYGKDGKTMPQALYTYEIGSLTKTFTAALMQKAVKEGKIDLNDRIDKYLKLSAENNYPTIAELLTHTSGYRDYYLESPMISNFFAGRNDFCGITDVMILDKLQTLNKSKTDYPFVYSNFGYATLGRVLEAVYGEEYTALANGFAAELGLKATHVSDGSGDLSNYWDWKENDAYISAGAITSNIEDMLKYAKLQLESDFFADCHKVIKDINATSKDNALMDIRMDSIGMAWITDRENGIVWHNGGTGNYNSYLGIDKDSGTAVVILANLAPSYKIPATVMGVKLLKEYK